MPPPPPSPSSCTAARVAGGAAEGCEDPFDGIAIPPVFLRWLLDDDSGCSYRTTSGAEAVAGSHFRGVAPGLPHPSTQQPSSPSCTVAGGAVGGGEDPFDGGIVIPPDYLRWLLDDDDGFLYRATTAAEGEASSMQRLPSSYSCSAAGGGAGGGEEDLFDDIVIPPDLLQGLDDDDVGCLHGAAEAMGAEAEDERRLLSRAQVGDHSSMQQPSSSPLSCTVAGQGAGGEAHAGGHVADGLSMTYRGRTHVFDSVPPHKVETILMLLNGYELASQCAKLKSPNLVHRHRIVVPQGFDRAVAMSRYRKKRKSRVKADYSIRREIALRIARRGGKFAPSEMCSENSVETCANCGESSVVTPQMRRGPSGAKNFCNSCGLAWATYRKIRNVKNAESRPA